MYRAVWTAGLLALPQVGSGVVSPPVSLQELAGHPVLRRSLHRRLVTDRVAPNGAAGVNRGAGPQWYIEEQRAGAEFVQRGVVMENAGWVSTGWRILDWGIARQGPDGGFPGTGDPFHSVSLFVEALSRALLLDPAAATPARVRAARAAAEWLLLPNVAGRGEAHNRPYTHRRWILAAALAQAAQAANQPQLMRAARSYARAGLQLQAENGVNPEKGGADIGYQMFGVVMAARFVAAGPDRRLENSVIRMIDKAATWAGTRIGEDGRVDATGSTRTSIETARDGRLKQVPHHSIVEGLAYSAALTGDSSYHVMAERVARRRGWLR